MITLSILPFFTFITVSAISAIKLLCVTIITVFAPLFPSHCFLRSFKTSTTVLLSNAPVGSSQSNNFGFLAIALAIDTLCCSPPDNWFGNFLLCSSNPTPFKASSVLIPIFYYVFNYIYIFLYGKTWQNIIKLKYKSYIFCSVIR